MAFNFSRPIYPLLALGLWLCAGHGYAQVTTVTLKDERSLRGELLHIIRDSSLVLVLAESDTLHLAWTEVRHYHTRQRQRLDKLRNSDLPGYRQRRRLYGEVGGGLYVNRRYTFTSPRAVGYFHLGAGYRLADRHSVGLLVDLVPGYLDEQYPVYLDYRHRLGNSAPSGWEIQGRVGVKLLGVGFPSGWQIWQKLIVNPSMAYRHRSPFRFDWVAGVGLRVHNNHLERLIDRHGSMLPAPRPLKCQLTFRYGIQF